MVDDFDKIMSPASKAIRRERRARWYYIYGPLVWITSPAIIAITCFIAAVWSNRWSVATKFLTTGLIALLGGGGTAAFIAFLDDENEITENRQTSWDSKH